MTGPVEALIAQQVELLALVADRPEDQLSLPSRCPGWSAADVLLHLAQTNEMAVASVNGRLSEFVASVTASIAPGDDVDGLAGALVDAKRSTPGVARDRYLTSARAQATAFVSCDLSARVQWVAGEMAARTLATTRLSETWIHTLDVAAAFGIEVPPTDRLGHVARMVWRKRPYRQGRLEPGVSPSNLGALVGYEIGMARQMSTSEWIAFVSEGTRTMKLAATRRKAGDHKEDGRPHVAPVWFVVEDGRFVFITGAESVKGRNLRRTGRATLVVDDEDAPFSFVMAEGQVDLENDPHAMLPLATCIARRYMGPELADEYGRRNAAEGEVLVSMKPTNVVALAEISD